MAYTNGNAHKFAVWRGTSFVHMFASLEDATIFALTRENATGDTHEVRRVSDADQRLITRQANERMGLGAWL